MPTPRPSTLVLASALCLAALGACSGDEVTPSADSAAGGPVAAGPDPHSYARPDEVAVRHLVLDLAVDFDSRTLAGTARLELERAAGADRLLLDTRGLEIAGVTLDEGREPAWSLAPAQPFLGRALTVELSPETEAVEVSYRTSPSAEALGWMEPAQTAGGRHPFLYTQSQAILARSWIPLQDTPGVRFTYEATIRVPEGLLAVMSAENPTETAADGVYRFTMPQAIPSYLMALAVGELEFRAMGERTGVYAEPQVVDGAAWEFAETEEMMRAAEELYGPYRWGRYDLLVLPASFPFGGMENPRLTFATPTIIAGDRSLVSLVAHELAHSWSGNLVTNADWNDFWLNEGFTVYFEQRIMEAVYGREYSEMLAVRSLQDLRKELVELPPADTHLRLDLAGRDPDDGMTAVAYDKGYFFLRTLEQAVGREAWDRFLRGYFEAFAFRPSTTETFLAILDEQLPQARAAVDVDAWVFGPGLPADADLPSSPAFDRVEDELAAWAGGRPASELPASDWSTHERVHFLRRLPTPLEDDRLAELDAALGLSETGNSEVLAAWLEVAVREGYAPAYGALERFLTSVGRRKFLRPLYRRLAATPEGLALGREIFAEARDGYHPISRDSVAEILGVDSP